MRISHNMHLALADISAGVSVKLAAETHGVRASSIYRALRKGKPRCPVCGSQRREVAGLLRDYKATVGQ